MCWKNPFNALETPVKSTPPSPHYNLAKHGVQRHCRNYITHILDHSISLSDVKKHKSPAYHAWWTTDEVIGNQVLRISIYFSIDWPFPQIETSHLLENFSGLPGCRLTVPSISRWSLTLKIYNPLHMSLQVSHEPTFLWSCNNYNLPKVSIFLFQQHITKNFLLNQAAPSLTIYAKLSCLKLGTVRPPSSFGQHIFPQDIAWSRYFWSSSAKKNYLCNLSSSLIVCCGTCVDCIT